MATPKFTLRSLLEVGVHLGHQSHRWNPRMNGYIHSKRNGIHIIDLTQTVVFMRRALAEIENVVSKGGSVLFVGTKRQAQLPIEDAAKKSAQHYVNHRWLGGTLTNWKTVSNSISRLDELDERIKEGLEGLTKKERLGMLREQAKLEASHGGIRNMKFLPDILFVIDVKKESLAIAEANKLNIPVVAIVDTNCPPEGITHIIPGNDDATRAIALYCDLVSKAAIEGINKELGQAGLEITEQEIEESLADQEEGGKAETANAPETESTKDKTKASQEEQIAEAQVKPGTQQSKPTDSKAKKTKGSNKSKSDDEAAIAEASKSDSDIQNEESGSRAKEKVSDTIEGSKSKETDRQTDTPESAPQLEANKEEVNSQSESISESTTLDNKS